MSNRPQTLIHPRHQPTMLKEIHAAPQRVAYLLDRETAGLERALARFRTEPPPLILVAGRGTSDNAAVYGRYLFEHFVGIPVSGAALSLFTLYPAPMHVKGALSIGASQSGESPDVVKALQAARRGGAYTVAITNVPDSSLARVADYTLLLHARKETAVAATKTYTASLAAMLMICRAIGGRIDPRRIAQIPEVLSAAARLGAGDRRGHTLLPLRRGLHLPRAWVQLRHCPRNCAQAPGNLLPPRGRHVRRRFPARSHCHAHRDDPHDYLRPQGRERGSSCWT